MGLLHCPSERGWGATIVHSRVSPTSYKESFVKQSESSLPLLTIWVLLMMAQVQAERRKAAQVAVGTVDIQTLSLCYLCS